jgi:hypothetical protein
LSTSESLIVTRGSNTVQALADANPWGRDRLCLSRHFSGKWDAGRLLDAGRRALLSHWEESPTPGADSQAVMYHIVDDTANPHSPARASVAWQERGSRAMEAVALHYDHNEGRHKCRMISALESERSLARWVFRITGCARFTRSGGSRAKWRLRIGIWSGCAIARNCRTWPPPNAW